MVFSSHLVDSAGVSPQLVGQVESISTIEKQRPSTWYLKARRSISLALTAANGECDEARATNAGVRSVEISSATRIGYPASSTSRPIWQVVADCPGIVVGAIWPPVIP